MKCFVSNILLLSLLLQSTLLQSAEGSDVGDVIKTVVSRMSSDGDVIADGSRPYTLPTVSGKHKDLKSISPDTV